MGGPRRRKAPTKKVWATLEIGYYDDLVRMMDTERRWKDEAAFVRDSIVEKVNRWRLEHTATAAPGYIEATDVHAPIRKERR